MAFTEFLWWNRSARFTEFLIFTTDPKKCSRQIKYSRYIYIIAITQASSVIYVELITVRAGGALSGMRQRDCTKVNRVLTNKLLLVTAAKNSRDER